MTQATRAALLAEAAAELSGHTKREASESITNSLVYGFAKLRKLLFQRIHNDVEQLYGMDSMISPISLEKSEGRSRAEIELYQIAVSANEVQQMGYVDDPDWYALWLANLRFADPGHRDLVHKRIHEYARLRKDKARLQFERSLSRVMPESTKAPLVLYRLYPLAVRITTATAFADSLCAAEHRAAQIRFLNVIENCHACNGRVLDNGEACDECGNPVWNYRWLLDSA